MNKINCTDRVLSLNNVESMRLIPRMDFVADVDGIEFHPKGEKFLKKHFWSEKKSFPWNMYHWRCYYTMTYSAEAIVEDIKKGNCTYFTPWNKFFIESIISSQIDYNKDKDCVTRKSTVVIRTKSGDTLYAVYDTDEQANNVINQFNR